MRQVPVDDLNDSANAEDERANDQGPPPAEPGGDGPYCETAKKCPGLQNTDAIGVDLSLLFLGIAKVALEGLEGEDTSNNASVIGEKE